MTRMRRGAVALMMIAAAGLSACATGDNGNDSSRSDARSEIGTKLDEEFRGHQLRDIPAESAPSVRLDVKPDDHGGWNLRLDTDRFSFVPERTGGDARGGEGHAHLYIDGEKYTRLYSDWFYLPKDAVESGEHTLLVTLNANDHTVWAPDGTPVTATATVTGESGADEHKHDDSGEHAQPNEPDPAEKDVELVEFAISNGKAEPGLERINVDKGSAVRIVVTSDQADQIHLHGYDLTAKIGPGQDGTIEFTADQSGQFELETHGSGLVLAQLLVR